MTETPTRADDKLDNDRRQAIIQLLLEGRRVHEVVAHGLTRQPGWRRNHVVDIIAEHRWTLDSDGRVPRRFRTQVIPPATPLPGAPNPAPPRRPVVEWPPEGTVTEGRGANAAAALIATGKAHQAAAIRRLAEKAEQALSGLSEALKADEENAVLRNRLAQIEAEAERLRARLRGVGRPKGSRNKAPGQVKDATLSKPINHGTWGGFLAHSKRHQPVPDGDPCGCLAAKNEHMDKLRAKSSRGGGGNG